MFVSLSCDLLQGPPADEDLPVVEWELLSAIASDGSRFITVDVETNGEYGYVRGNYEGDFYEDWENRFTVPSKTIDSVASEVQSFEELTITLTDFLFTPADDGLQLEVTQRIDFYVFGTLLGKPVPKAKAYILPTTIPVVFE